MDTLKELLHKILNEVAEKGYRYRVALKVMMVTVVFVTTYMLILPAITLEVDKAAAQGGIDVPGIEQTAEQADEQSVDDSDGMSADVPEEESVSDSDVDTSAGDPDAEAAEADNEQADELNEDEVTEVTEEDVESEPEPESPKLTFEGRGFTVDVEDPQGVLPEDTQLAVTEITNDDKQYDKYCSDALAALKDNTGTGNESEPGFVRLYDIKLIAGDDVIEPEDSVEVTITYDNEHKSNSGENALRIENEDNVYVVHFKEDENTGKEQAEVLDKETTSFHIRRKQLEEATFEADSFSVYAIVEAPNPVPMTVIDVSELLDNDESFLLSLNRNSKTQYYLNTLNRNSAFNVVDNNPEAAADWHFEDAGNDTFYIITYVDGVKKYVNNPSGNLVGLVNEDSSGKSKFEISPAGDGTFYIKKYGENKWLQYSNGGSGIRFWNDKNNADNSKTTITYADTLPVPDDPYGLNGKTYGIAYHNSETSAAAITADGKTTGGQSRLEAEKLLIRPDILNHNGILLVDEGKDMVEWSFECVSEDKYYITTTVDGQKKYLTINNKNVTLEDSPVNDQSLITVRPGTGEHKGEFSFSVHNYYLNLEKGSVTEGFNGLLNPGSTSWLNLVEKTPLNDDDFTYYTARKVSVSDTERVKDGSQVVLYTRIWNKDKRRYDFFVVDHDGTLLPCNDSGDAIEWIAGGINTALWNFTEYTGDDGSPSNYYELQNTQYGDYIAPQVSKGESGQVFSPDKIGINLNGRRDGENSTTIIAWDGEQYAYSALKTENGHVVPCTLSEAEDFYFAIIQEPDPEEPITEVSTVDNNRYGITMKMVDFNNPVVNNRDSVQFPFFGGALDEAGLLSSNLDGDGNGYPSTTEKTGHVDPISEMFTGMTDVNHLFLQSIYNESGYFEYDSTQNFAHLNKDGNFTVYDQLAAIDGSSGPTRTHGQFMPYNDIDPNNIITEFNNRTDVRANELPDTDPRKGEDLYRIPLKKADYFFGMEMDATFTQTANGLDAWGHDIIFEFSGDDDFWFYVDGELVLDLGGVHSAMSGSINFRTGEIKSDRGNSTLYETFRSNYQARGMSEDEIARKLDELFKQNDKGQYVFRDYTNHDMKMFYMERGAGASNLHMRFNLAAVEPGSFLLSKKLSGTDSPKNDLIEFPYQIYYTTNIDGNVTEHLLGDTAGDQDRVTYKDTTTKVKFAESYTPAGGTVPYADVFFLKPGQEAQVKLPEGTVSYRVVECGVNPDVYDVVKVNEDEPIDVVTQNTVGSTHRHDYSTIDDTLTSRPRVDFDNHVSEGAMRTLSFTKKLYGTDGETILHYEDDNTPFDLRLYLGNESADPEKLPPANLYKYYVKDGNGNYCRWNAQDKVFESLGIQDYESLVAYLETVTAREKDAIVFITSPNGSISNIPADHTVEVRDLIVDTQYKIEEREEEIPKGYTLRILDGYTRTDGDEKEPMGDEPVSGDINVDVDPAYEIRNQRGWGLTAKKVWTDKDFMKSHDDIFFAVYLVDREGQDPHNNQLIDGTVRRLKTDEDEIYYFFEDLKQHGHTYRFSQFVVREVEVHGDDYSVDEETGVVTGYTNVVPVEDGQRTQIGGTPIGGKHHKKIQYTVNYDPGESTGHNENVRTDIVTNSRPGIKIYKTIYQTEDDWNAPPLGGATFTLTDSNGDDVAAESYTSRDSDGLVTIAYVDPGTYTLTEIKTPKGYVAMDEPLTFTVLQNNNHIDMVDTDLCKCTYQAHDHNDMSKITIRNRAVELQAVKIDSTTQQVIEGTHFALYRQVTDTHGVKRKDYNPMPGFEDLVTDANGIIPLVDMVNLDPGTYYLDETIPAAGYEEIDDICFTIGVDGTVTLNSGAHSSLSQKIDETRSKKIYTLTVINGKMKKVSFMKVDIAAPDNPVVGAEFDLYDVVDGERADTARISGLVSGSDGMLAKDGKTEFELPVGTYQLIETKAPDGYVPKEDPVEIVVTSETDSTTVDFDDTTTINGVTYDEGTTLSSSGKGIAYNNDSKVYTMKISNTAGVELPSCGGIGTTVFYVLGAVLFLLSACGLITRLRRAL